MQSEEKTAFLAFISNIILFLLKIFAAIASGSLAVLSSAFDSLNDIISYLAGYYSVKEAVRGPDEDHPFGHRRMESLAAMVTAIFAGILAFEILRSGFLNLLMGEHTVEITTYVFGILIATVVVKLFTYIVLERKSKTVMSSALDAMMVDSRNDVLSNCIAIVGITGAYFGMVVLDDIAAIFIALYIAYAGYQVARKNFDYMVGARPEKKIMDSIKKKAAGVKGVKKVGAIRAHYVGDRVHAEIEIVLPKKIKGPESHDIAIKVQYAVESLKIVSRAFVHIDYG